MAPKIPLIDLEAQIAPIRDEIVEAVTRCIDSHRYILGDGVTRLESRLADRAGVAHAVGVSSGTDALLMCLMALDVGTGDEVVTTAYSFFATASTIVRLGAKPVFVDIDEHTFNIDTAQLEAALTARTKAIVPVHLYGRLADMESIDALARDHDIAIIEDAAQAIGAEGAGTVGAMSSLSFYPSKNLSAMGEAGMVLTDDETYASVLRRLRNHGAETSYVHDIIGGNFRMDAFQAAVLNVKLGHLDSWTTRRRERAKLYTELFHESGVVDSGHITLPEDSAEHVYHQYVIRSAERDALKARLAAEDIASGVYYPLPLPLQPCFASLGYGPGDFPEAERAAQETLALPIYPELTDEQQRSIVSILSR